MPAATNTFSSMGAVARIGIGSCFAATISGSTFFGSLATGTLGSSG
ncbi:MAG: hypothetical protein WDM70_07485 [Nitrosomonadales bacterium]